ncbi:MAG: HEAT repeat domain-containing protein [Spirochaetia bacterium]|nr:HEAT repeat domain-containing protein [Spirochaetia bacterium]
MKSRLSALLVLALCATLALPVLAQATGEKTVEEAYLQETLETLIIREQAHADGRDMKLVALQYIEQAISEGRKGEEIRLALEYLALETTQVSIREAGYGRVINDYPDVRAKACELLAEFPSVETKDALLKVALADRETMVISAAIRSLGKIGINEADEVTTAISFIVNKYDLLLPDNSLAFEALVALELLHDETGALKDAAAIRMIMRIADGNYIKPVKDKARALLDKLRKSSGK